MAYIGCLVWGFLGFLGFRGLGFRALGWHVGPSFRGFCFFLLPECAGFSDLFSKENEKTLSPNGEGGGENLVENIPNRGAQKTLLLA